MAERDQIGHYRITGKLGEGGMGIVYAATDTKLGRSVAIKILPESFAADADRLARFKREAQVLASLNHPNIAVIHGIEDRALVLELIPGPTLAQRVAEGPVPLDEAIDIAKQVAEALEYAHEHGIVHRDLKPANIKITPEGRVKILDFGLAKAFGVETASGSSLSSPTRTMQATIAGVVMGTAAYMSPEQARGKTVDKRADIWAFGVVLYEMLSGKPLFQRETITDTLAGVVKDAPDLQLIPWETHRLIEACLQKDPRNRLRDIGDAFKLIQERAAQPAAAAARPKTPWIIAAAALLSTVALATLHWSASSPQVPAVRLDIVPPLGVSLETYVAVSPDGRRVAFTASGSDGRVRIWLRDLSTQESKPLAGTENPGSLIWSPDSRFIAFGNGTRLRKIDVSGGTPETLCETSSPVGSGSWSDAGIIIFGGRGFGPVQQVSANGGTPTPVTKLDHERGETFHAFPSFLPDGRRFIFFRGSQNRELAGLYSGSLDLKPADQPLKPIMLHRLNALFAQGPDKRSKGYLLFLREHNLIARAFDTGTMELFGDPVSIADSVGSTNQYSHFSVSKNGILAYKVGTATGAANQLTWFDRQGHPTSVQSEGFNSVSLSPDGTRVIGGRPRTEGGSPDLWMFDTVRLVNSRISFGSNFDISPVWSPDGSRIAYAANRGGVFDLYVKPASGSGSEQLLFASSESKTLYDWSLDGSWLLFGSTDAKSNKDTLWVLQLASRKPVPYITDPYNFQSAQFSPDGKFVAYASDESGSSEVYVQTFPNPSAGKWQISRNGGSQPRWRHDGKELYYVSFDSKIVAVGVDTTHDFRASPPQPLFDTQILGGNANYRLHRYAVARDGQRFLISTGGATGPQRSITVDLNWTDALRRQ